MAFPDGWTKYKEITIAPSVTSGAVTGGLAVVNLKDQAEIVAGMKTDGSDLRFTTADGSTILPHGTVPFGHYVSYDGVVTYWHRDYATRHVGTKDQTYVGWINSSGRRGVAAINHDTGAMTFGQVGTGVIDDHDNPSLFVRSDGRILAAHCNHNGPELWLSKSTNPEDVTAWNTAVAISPRGTAASGSGYTYPSMLWVASEGTTGRLYMTYRTRTPTRQIDYIYSDDEGDTWSAPTVLWTPGSQTPYLNIISNGTDRLHIIATGHGDEGSSPLWHFYGSHEMGWFGSNGTAIVGTPGEAAGIMPEESRITTGHVWTGDVCLDASGQPRVLYYVYGNAPTNYQNQQVHYAKRVGGTWTTSHVLNEGPGFVSAVPTYTGSVRFDPEDHTHFYTGVEVSGKYEIQEWATTNDGASWAKSQDITSGSATLNYRPFVAKNRDKTKGPWLFWCGDGFYNNYLSSGSFKVGIRCYPPIDGGHKAAQAIVKTDISSTVSTVIRCYYGNPDATDAQDRATVAAGFDFFAPFAIEPGTDVRYLVDWSANARNATATGQIEGSSSGPVGGQTFGGLAELLDHRWSLPQFSMTSAAAVSQFVFQKWKATGAAKRAMFCNWHATKAGIMARMNSSNQVECYIRHAGGFLTQNIAGPPSGSWATMYMEYDSAAAGFRVRTNTTEVFAASGTGQVLGTSLNEPLVFGTQSDAIKSDDYAGEVAFGAFKLGTLSKAFTDALSNTLRDHDTYVTFGAEQAAEPGAIEADPLSIQLALELSSPAVTVSYTASPEPIQSTLEISAPDVGVAYVVSPESIELVTGLSSLSVSFTLPDEAVPLPIQLGIELSSPTVSFSVASLPEPIQSALELSSPSVVVHVGLSAEPLQMALELSSPAVTFSAPQVPGLKYYVIATA